MFHPQPKDIINLAFWLGAKGNYFAKERLTMKTVDLEIIASLFLLWLIVIVCAYFAKRLIPKIISFRNKIAKITIGCLAVLGVLGIMYISLLGEDGGIYIGKILGLLLGGIVLFFVWLGSLVGLSFSQGVVLVWTISLIACGIIFYRVGLKEGKNEQNNP